MKSKILLWIAILFILLLTGLLLYPIFNPPLPPLTIPLPTTVPMSLEIGTSENVEPESTVSEPEVVEPNILNKLQAVYAQNEDVIGWLTLPNTSIDYPVAQSNDNDYYLHKDLDEKYYDPGTLFMDFRNSGDLNDRYAIIYGHNMKNGSMFGTLKQYKDKAFYDANPIFTYSNLYEESQWEIFAAYVSRPTLDLIVTDFADDEAFLNYLKERSSKSKYPVTVDIKATDKILTLITCSYEFNDARFVIHARKVE